MVYMFVGLECNDPHRVEENVLIDNFAAFLSCPLYQ